MHHTVSGYVQLLAGARRVTDVERLDMWEGREDERDMCSRLSVRARCGIVM